MREESSRSTGKASANPWCTNCGRTLRAGAESCRHCGAGVPDLAPARPGGALDSLVVHIGLLGATLAWALISVFFASGPIPSLGWMQEFAITMAVLLPWLLVPALVIYRNRKKANQIRISGTTETIESLSPGLLLLVTTTWVLVMLVLASYVMIDPFTTIMLVLFPTLGLAGCWLALTVRAAYRARKAPTMGAIAKTVAYLVSFPLAAIAMFMLTADEVPLRVRFGISETAMYDRLERFERTGEEESYGSDLIGLYKVDAVYRHAGCVILQTMRGIEETGGFAYCPGTPPTDPELEHLKGRWWIYRSWH